MTQISATASRDELLGRFLTEASESLRIVADRFPSGAEGGPRPDVDDASAIVRAIGDACGVLQLPRLQTLAGAGSRLLDSLRSGAAWTPEAAALLHRLFERVNDVLGDLELLGVEPEGDNDDLIGAMTAMSESMRAAVSPDPEDVGAGAEPTEPEIAPERPRAVDAEPAFVRVDPSPAPEFAPTSSQSTEETGASAQRSSNRSMAVDLDVLVSLMTGVDALVSTRNQLLHMVRGLDDSVFKAPLQRLSVITGELQESVMKTRVLLVSADGDGPEAVAAPTGQRRPKERRHRVLLVEDSALFRQLADALLSAEGHEVATAASAEQAWRLLSDGSDFDAVVFDAELRNPDGLEFAEGLRRDARWGETPRIGLTELPVAEMPEHRRDAFSRLVRKSDRDGLIDSLEAVLNPEPASARLWEAG